MVTRTPETLAVAFPSHHPRTLTGSLELDLASTVWSSAPRPTRVGRVIELMFDRISGRVATPERIRNLASSAREWLLQRAALRLWSDSGWFQARCTTCERDFDLPISLSRTPRKPAGTNFPVVEVETSLGRRSFEAPNGDHEEQLARDGDNADPVRRLLGLCSLHENAMAEAALFSAADLARIDAALEDACPDVADLIHTRCPTCATPIEAHLDPLKFAFPRSQTLLHEVHLIAETYHWSECDILSLPSFRRSVYVDLIRSDQRRGMSK